MNLSNLKIISGGQTGVDRGALEAASLMASMGLAGWGGYAPNSFKAEDGTIPEPFRSQMKPAGDYVERTILNIQAAHGTVVVYTKANQIVNRGGTQMTLLTAWKEGRAVLPLFVEASSITTPVALLVTWIQHLHVVAKKLIPEHRGGDYTIVNFAGPRESKCPGIQDLTCEIVGAALEAIRA